jgi:UDP-galactopyranose mutase
MKNADILIIGAGISGATLAERYASLGKTVLILEKRNHIGGNCYDYYNDDGILISKYGAHLFHTNDEDVWKYVNRFATWYPYEHRVKAFVDGKLVPIPVNITTVNQLFGLHIQNEKEMQGWLKKHQIHNSNPHNGEEAALARVGKTLYEKMFKNYTKKQWDKYPEELDASVLNRIPVRDNFDDRYFSDKYQALPEGGYTPLFQKMLSHPNITVALDSDYFDIRDRLGEYEKIFYTGPIDQFFDFKYSVDEHLEYRSLRFQFETHDKEFYQKHSVINYPNDHKFTRIVEYKHFTKQKHPKTTISKEFSVDYEPGVNEPYYPVPNPRNQAIYEKYRKETEKLKNIFFVGRLANYKYFNMDQAFKAALDLFDSLEKIPSKKNHLESPAALSLQLTETTYDSSTSK